MPDSPNDPLPGVLASWRLRPTVNPRFRADVWQRIEAAGRPSNWARFARAHPALVSSILAAAVVVGAVSGRTEARQKTEADRAAVAASYVHQLDARWMRQQ